MAFVRELTKCTAASRRPELERRNMVRSSPIGTCASTASRSPRRFRDGAAKFDLGTVIRVARSRGFTARLWFWCVNKAGRPLAAAANVDGELEVFCAL